MSAINDLTIEEAAELYRLDQAKCMIGFAKKKLKREPTLADLERMSLGGDFAPISGSDGKIRPYGAANREYL